MKGFTIYIFILLIISGCTKPALSPLTGKGNEAPVGNNSDTITYLALGDSYTIGEAEPQDASFPYQLVNSLRTYSAYSVTNPYIIATTGWTTDNLISAIAASNIHAKTYSFVTLLIGVNDEYQGLSESNYKAKFAQVLNTAIGLAQGDTSRVFVLSIPDWGVTPYGSGQDSIIGPKIDEFNAINKTISITAGVHYLDITAISRKAATDPTLIAPDNLHPSGKMYAEWIDLLEPMVLARLKKIEVEEIIVYY